MELRLKVSDELHRKLKAMARANDINMTAQAKLYISQGLREDNPDIDNGQKAVIEKETDAINK